MDALTRTYIRVERDRITRERLGPNKGGRPVGPAEPHETRPDHWPELIVFERSGLRKAADMIRRAVRIA